MSPSRIVLLADQVLTLDAAATIHAPGAVTIEGAEIRAVGPPPARPAGEIVDLRGSVLLPGLVNTRRPVDLDSERILADAVQAAGRLADVRA